MSVEKGLIGKQDIEFGTSTFSRKKNDGSSGTLDQIRASHLPIVDAGSKFTGEEVESALQECQAENSTGSNSKDYTNKSGASRSAGDIVRVDSDNDDSFETTTTSGDSLVMGVVAETIADTESGKVITGGYVATLTVDGACARGSFLKASSTEAKATPETSLGAGSFAIALSSTGGAGTVSAYIFGGIGGAFLPLAGGALTGPVSWKKGEDVDSANALSLGTDGNIFDIIGVVTITSIATKAVGRVVILQFDGALTLTHHVTNLILPGGQNITTVAGDVFIFYEYAIGNWRLVCSSRPTYIGTHDHSSSSTGGFSKGIIQEMSSETGAVSTGTTQIPWDDTIPQSDEGDEWLTLSITPKSTDHELHIAVQLQLAKSGSAATLIAALFKDSEEDAVAAAAFYSPTANETYKVILEYVVDVPSTSAITYKVRVGSASSGTTTVNGTGGGRQLGGVLVSSIHIQEINQ